MTVESVVDNVGIVVEDIDAAIEFSPNLASSWQRRAPQSKETGQMAGRAGLRRTCACRDCHDAYAGRPQLGMSRFLAARRRSPITWLQMPRHMARYERRLRLPTRHVHRGGHRRYARPARQTRRGARRRSGPGPKTRIGSATSGAPKEFSSGSPKSSGRTDFPMSTCDGYRPDRGAYSRGASCPGVYGTNRLKPTPPAFGLRGGLFQPLGRRGISDVMRPLRYSGQRHIRRVLRSPGNIRGRGNPVSCGRKLKRADALLMSG